MKILKQILLTLFFALYLTIILLTDISLTGFWTDIIFSILLSIFTLRIVYKNKTDKYLLTLALRAAAVTCSVIIFVLLGLNIADPFAWDILKMRSFYFQKVNGRVFNAYFKPVGSYSGGYGNFWITESPKYFPLIERRVYYDRTVHWDFNDDNWDGKPIDNYEVVREYIKSEVIEKKN
jgi:hypothetical protein